ncbi:MAG: hypothetical protein EPGJADBJ_04478 [Saprospiraceae bacterium]|nr:hypothetical protein [Saprospiraceae bacterium]
MAFNSKQYAFSDITVNVLGRELQGFRGVKYKVSVEKEVLHARGKKAFSIQSGNETIEGELMLLQSELEALRAAVKSVNPDLKLTDVAFDIVVTYGNGTTAVTDIIQGAEFTEYEKGMENGDKQMEISLPFLALDVKEGA